MIQIRRVFTHLEEIRHEFGPVADVPLLRGAIGAVLTNPFAGRYEPDILPMIAPSDVDPSLRPRRPAVVTGEPLNRGPSGRIVQGRPATASISTPAPSGSAATANAARAGSTSPVKYRA